MPPADARAEDGAEIEDVPSKEWRPRRTEGREGADGDEGRVARINLRLPDNLKSRVEQAAADDGLSINAWLVRAAAWAVERGDAGRRRERRPPHGGERYRGWAR
jgi:hypothetical protein